MSMVFQLYTMLTLELRTRQRLTALELAKISAVVGGTSTDKWTNFASGMLPELLEQIPPGQEIGSVTADGIYDTRKCHEAIAARSAHAFGHSFEPMAGMPPLPSRKNAKPWKPTSAGAIARYEAVNAAKYLGRAIWRRW